jgi:hypothetical protein
MTGRSTPEQFYQKWRTHEIPWGGFRSTLMPSPRFQSTMLNLPGICCLIDWLTHKK